MLLLLVFLIFLSQSEGFTPISKEESTDIAKTCGLRYGYKSYDVKILNGRKANPKQFPWVVEITYRRECGGNMALQHHCGGSLITKRHVITAAHCVQEMNPKDLQVHVGGLKTMTGMVMAIKNIKVFPNYHNGGASGDDLALLELYDEVSEEFFQKGLAATICLPVSNYLYQDHFFVLPGWGLTLNEKTEGLLMWTKLNPMSHNECVRRDSNTSLSLNNTICTLEVLTNACRGDSGGPLLQKSKQSHHREAIIGLVSRGTECGDMKGMEEDDEVEFPGGLFPDIRPQSRLEWICKHTGACYTLEENSEK